MTEEQKVQMASNLFGAPVDKEKALLLVNAAANEVKDIHGFDESTKQTLIWNHETQCLEAVSMDDC